MVTVQEFEKYTETEKQDIFLSQNELQQFKEREMMLIVCKTKQSIYRRLLSFAPLLNNDLDCTTIMTLDEIKLRKKIRQAAVATVLNEQKFNRDYGIIEAVHWEGGRNLFSAVAEQQALRRGIQAESER
ncbi:hypothetical protein IV203_030811 [Nitzschia inconspicua]|uniref:Uncharacterized protein n=1 Tax=Nitzschia inconspicua TaxID=303405 RepID=A0A9K3Q224_9STRA|nr:hypothetical protein IV203_030811 [Nitzschia inconspicua]